MEKDTVTEVMRALGEDLEASFFPHPAVVEVALEGVVDQFPMTENIPT